ncbi:ATPase AAA [Clostridium sulfidigenes]|uniref:ATP-dependent RecD2 DNA helicase n=1 Tax=Clostridium sulfidigenes TaxID=318464 RepID=A0A084JHU7_9CLOT|nr:ATP-dependent RecD-like DNA helicase [Clostridium sulfidigenes]KEZ88531.1 ATPase AAA [Clostridium sulfidigenes]
MITIEGIVETVVFRNDDNGYTICKLRCDKEVVTIVGTIPFINESQEYSVQGEWTVHPKFGKQFKIESIHEIIPTTTSGIEKYLASGVIEGIGKVTAKKIVEFFGEDTIKILDSNIEKLEEIPGIGKKRINTIMKSYLEQRVTKDIIIFFQSYGITVNMAMKIYKKFGVNCINIVKDNPYILTEYISGIGFRTADSIAKSLGIEKDSLFRIKSGVIYIINEFCTIGNTFIPMDRLRDKGMKLLEINSEKFDEGVYELIIDGKIKVEVVDNIDAVYNMSYLYLEMSVTRKIVELATTNYDKLSLNVNEKINDFESKANIKLANSQKEAIEGAFFNGIEVITGGPGTGKTTIINCIVSIFESLGLKVFMAAPTGRAAKRMAEATGREAKTIHRLLEIGSYSEEEVDEIENETSAIECDVLIVDEASMVDISLMNALLKAMQVGTRLIIVGDVDQLPSVGPGNVLRDIIESDAVKVVRLNEIFRQGQESMIVQNAHLINEGKMPILNTKNSDFYLERAADSEVMLEKIIGLVKTRLPKFNVEWDSVRDIQVLSPMRKGIMGIDNLNIQLQQVLNPKSKDKDEVEIKDMIFRVGDKVMQIKNNYTLKWSKNNSSEEGKGVFNGDVGYITEISEDEDKITVCFEDDKIVEYEESDLDEITLAYAVTIHKSQGSEFPVVIMPMFMGPPLLMNRNLLYTGITRAKKLVVLVGNSKVVEFMKDNNRSFERYSGLKWRIREIIHM